MELQSSFATTTTPQNADLNTASDTADGIATSANPKPIPVSAKVSSITAFYSTMDTERWLPEMKFTAEIDQSGSQPVASRTILRPTRIAAGLDDVVNDFPDVPLEELTGVNEAGESTGARIKIHLKPRADEKGRQTIQLGARDVDLRLVQPLLSMMGLDVSCDGIISCGIDARMAGATLNEGLVGRLKLIGDNVRIRQQSWAKNEWLPMGRVDAKGAVAIAEDGLLIEDLLIQSDVAQVMGSGELRHRPGAEGDSNAESRQKIEIKGMVDLAHLTSSLRQTLAIHSDVTIQQGRLTFGLRGSAGSGDEVASDIPGSNRCRNQCNTEQGVSVTVRSPCSLDEHSEIG